MKYEEVSWYSKRVNRWMRIKIYGHYGPAFIAFPCQDKQSDDFYNNGMIDALSYYLEQGKMKLFCLDSNDDETVSYKGWDKAHAAYMFEMYHQYLINEVLPFVYTNQGGHCEPYLIGASMGGAHAANHFFRRPELFAGFICLSGKFDMDYFFDGYMDTNVYNNSPQHYLSNMPNDHYYINIYNQKPMIVVLGKGAFEYLVAESNYRFADLMYQKGIHVDFNWWDENAVHDWVSWRYEMPYFIGRLLN